VWRSPTEMPTLDGALPRAFPPAGVGGKVMKSVTAAALSVLLLVTTLPMLFAGGDSTSAGTSPGCRDRADPVGSADGRDAVLAAVRQRESGGDYRAEAAGSTASGAYQFTDSTWDGYGGYGRAANAPPHVQDAKAAAHVQQILAANGGDVGAVPVVWYLGYVPPPHDPAWDRVPAAAAGNRLTPRQYQAEWLSTYGELVDADGPPRGASPNAAPASTCLPAEQRPPDVALVTVEGMVVNAEIADGVARLVEAARSGGFRLTGGGYRGGEEQILLRRQNCGTSSYAIYEMPPSSCSPPTARPGSSNHERGLAVDFGCDGELIRSRTSACFRWLADHAPIYGMHNLPSEPWHWSRDGR
jgi:hypothetical protein